MIPWHPHTELPARVDVTAILAAPVLPGYDWKVLDGIFIFTPYGWRSWRRGSPVDLPEFWWCAEADLLAHLRPRICFRTNGHG